MMQLSATGNRMSRIVAIISVLVVMLIAALCMMLAASRASLSKAVSDKRVLASDNALQREVIATQVFNIHRFNQTAASAAQANALANARSDNTVIEYREILHNEKTCDFAVPGDVSRGLLRYASRLRASALTPHSGRADASSSDAFTAATLTYCQAVLWVQPLLAAIETANNQLAGIREIEQLRAQQGMQTRQPEVAP